MEKKVQPETRKKEKKEKKKKLGKKRVETKVKL